MIHAILEYLRNRQSPKIRFLHIVVLLLVISQIVVSNYIDFTSAGEISKNTLNFYGTWTHIITGITLLPMAFVFALLVMREHGFKHFFPYLFGDFKQLKNDINKVIKFDLPAPKLGGLAAIVEGLGIGALFLALLSGLTWFIVWEYNVQWSHYVKELHESLVGLIEAYIIGHGSMGLLHIYLSTKNK
jgi:hypothetical protein